MGQGGFALKVEFDPKLPKSLLQHPRRHILGPEFCLALLS